MSPNPIAQYLTNLRTTLKGGDATERTYYPVLAELLQAVRPGVRVLTEPKRSRCGAPDFVVKRGDLTVGHVEAKDLGASLDEAEASDQLKRYRGALPNLILTNFLEFRWYVRDEHRRTVRLGELRSDKIAATAAGRTDLEELLAAFLSAEPQGAENARDLATRLARLAHEIRNVVAEGFGLGDISRDVTDLRDAVKQELVPDLDEAQFADLFAQTLAYGFFAAWVHHPDNDRFRRAAAAQDIPKTNPFLRRIFDMITGAQLDDEPFAGYVDDLVQLLDRTEKGAILEDFARKTGREDPVVHFYETFLQAYDPRIRELRGVYYTPEPVVSYIVQSVDHLLKTRFGLPGGLADTTQATCEVESESGETVSRTGPRVLILDPACGTGTFLYEIVNHIRDGFRRDGKSGAWSGYVREHLLPRLFGFELLMAPYAMAHLKLAVQLAGKDLDEPQRSAYAYDFASDERLGVFLTNSLEEAARKAETLFGPLRVITEEANAAAEIKRDKPIMVVVGNPPYSGHSANRSWEKRNGKRVATFIGELLQDYYRVDGQPLGEKNPKWLQDDYVKFIRFGQWRIERSGGGILALITNHSYLDNPTFRGMRQQLMEAFSEIYLLDLHGNSRKKEVCPDGSKDENVFDIQQGVAIAIFVKRPVATDRVSVLPEARGCVGPELTVTRRHLPHWQMGGSTYFITFRLQGAGRPGRTGAPPVTAATDRVSVLPEAVTATDRVSVLPEGAPPAHWTDRVSVLLEGERAIVKREILHWHGERWTVHALTVMPDHVHILATPLEQSSGRWHPLSAILRSVKYGSALKINRARGRTGSLWQDESFDRIVRDEKELEEKANYILGNAGKAGLALDGWEYDGFWCEEMEGETDRASAQTDRVSVLPGLAPPVEMRDRDGERARVFHADLWGVRKGKESYLAEQSCGSVEWREIRPQSPGYLFVPRDEGLSEEYEAGVPVSDIMGVNSVGIVTARDRLTIHWSGEEAWRTATDFAGLAVEEAREKYSLGRDAQDWRVAWAQQDVQGSGPDQRCVEPVLYRPFDTRFTYYTGTSRGFICRPRAEVMRHMLAGANVGLCVGRAGAVVGGDEWTVVWSTRNVTDFNLFYRGGNCLFPLYLYPEEGKSAISRSQRIHEAQQALAKAGGDAEAQRRLAETINHLYPESEYPRWPNLDPLLLVELEERLGLRFTFPAAHAGRTDTLSVRGEGSVPVADGASALPEVFGPEDVFNYIYAVLHCPSYRERYAEFLKRDLPRVPFTSDPGLFARLAGKGGELVALHLLEAPALAEVGSELIGDGENRVEQVRYDGENERVYISRTQHFRGVPRQVWEFRVGGYRVCEKWLKDRKGRTLSYDEQAHYSKVRVALGETIRLMAEIDAMIPSWPIV